MLERLFGTKRRIPAQYGVIIRKHFYTDEDYYETSERVLLRQDEIIQIGGVFEREPMYGTRSERVFVQEKYITCKKTGKVFYEEPTTKVVTKQVITGYRTKFKIGNLFKPLSTVKSQKVKAPDREQTKRAAIFLLQFFLPREIREEAIGDILEDYNARKDALGRHADLWIVKEMTFTLLNIFLDWLITKMRLRNS